MARVQERNASAGTSKKKTKGGAAARQYQPDEGTFTIAFFHPHCSSGGGGERVLWKTVEALGQLKEEALNNNHGDKLRHKSVRNLMSEEVRNNCKNLAVIIYTIDEPSESYDRGTLCRLLIIYLTFRIFGTHVEMFIYIANTLVFYNAAMLFLLLHDRPNETHPRTILHIHITQTRNTLRPSPQRETPLTKIQTIDASNRIMGYHSFGVVCIE